IAIRGCLVIHDTRTFILSVRLGERKLKPLIAGDRRCSKHFALQRVVDSELDREFGGADEASGRDDPLGIEYIQKLPPSVIQRSDQLVWLNAYVIEEDGAGRDSVCANLLNGGVGKTGTVDIDQEHADAVGTPRYLVKL